MQQSAFEAFIFELLALKAQRFQYSRPFKNNGTNCNAIVPLVRVNAAASDLMGQGLRPPPP